MNRRFFLNRLFLGVMLLSIVFAQPFFAEAKFTQAQFRAVLEEEGLAVPPTKKFSPRLKASFQFAVNTLCRLQNWTTVKTYKKCLAHAKTKGWLASSSLQNTKTNSPLSVDQVRVLLDASKDIIALTPSNLTATLRKGTTVILPNNITIRVEDILLQYGRADVTVTHFIGKIPLNTVPEVHALANPAWKFDTGTKSWNEDYGYRITTLSGVDNENDADESLTVEFKILTGFINSPQDLYGSCMEYKKKHRDCLKYSFLTPLDTQDEIDTAHFKIFGLKSARSSLETFGVELEKAYREVAEFLGVEKKTEIFPVHIFQNDGGDPIVSGSAIYWGTNTAEAVAEPYVLRHEIVHAIVFQAPFSKILNEGLATYVGYAVLGNGTLQCENSGWKINGAFSPFGRLDSYEKIPYKHGGSDLYYTAACFWDEFVKEYGRQNFLKSMKMLGDLRGKAKNNPSTLELIEKELNINLDRYRDKYGFRSPPSTNGGINFETAERYVPWGGSGGSRWDGKYEKNE